MTHLNELAKEFGSKGLVVIALSKEAKGTIEPWLEAQGAEYPVFVDDGGATASAYGVSGIPNAALIGPDGKVAWQGHPGDLNAQMVEPVLKDCVLRFEYAFPQLAPLPIEREWSGAWGWTPDFLPLVGPIPGRSGEWAITGFEGGGLAFAFEAGRAVAHAIVGDHAVAGAALLNPARFDRTELCKQPA